MDKDGLNTVPMHVWSGDTTMEHERECLHKHQQLWRSVFCRGLAISSLSDGSLPPLVVHVFCKFTFHHCGPCVALIRLSGEHHTMLGHVGCSTWPRVLFLGHRLQSHAASLVVNGGPWLCSRRRHITACFHEHRCFPFMPFQLLPPLQ